MASKAQSVADLLKSMYEVKSEYAKHYADVAAAGLGTKTFLGQCMQGSIHCHAASADAPSVCAVCLCCKFAQGVTWLSRMNIHVSPSHACLQG